MEKREIRSIKGVNKKPFEEVTTLCVLIIDNHTDEMIKSITQRYAEAMVFNLHQRFSSSALNIIDAL